MSSLAAKKSEFLAAQSAFDAKYRPSGFVDISLLLTTPGVGAELQLAWHYAAGHVDGPLDVNLRKAEQHYRIAAYKWDHAEGFLGLGLLYYFSDIRHKTKRQAQTEAWSLIRQAARRGDAIALRLISAEQVLTSFNKPVDESKTTSYSVSSPPSEAADIRPPPMEDAGQIINKLVALVPKAERPAFKMKLVTDFEAAGGVIVRSHEAPAAHALKRGAKAKPRAKKGNPRLTLARLKTAYEVLVRESNLANPELSEDERLRLARHITETYDRLRRHDRNFHDNATQLRLARNLMNSKNYQRRKAKKVSALASSP